MEMRQDFSQGFARKSRNIPDSFEDFLKENSDRYQDILPTTIYLFFLIAQGNLREFKAQNLDFKTLCTMNDAYGQPLIEWAIINDQQAILDYIYQHMFIPYVRSTPLININSYNNLLYGKLLCRQPDCSIKDFEEANKSEIYANAVRMGHNSLLQEFILSAKEPEHLAKYFLLSAAFYNRVDVVKTLLDKYPHLVNFRNNHQYTPIVQAVIGSLENKTDFKKLINLLLLKGADINTQFKNHTLLEIAIAGKSLNLFLFLLEKGANVNVSQSLLRLTSAKNLNSDIALKMLKRLLEEPTLDPREKQKHFELLINVYLNASDRNKKMDLKAIELFCQDGQFDLNRSLVLVPNNNTALHEAVSKVDYELAKLLITYGANVEKRNNLDNTPLHLLFEIVFGIDYQNNHESEYDCNEVLNLVSLLLDHGADFKTEGYHRMIPINAPQLGETVFQNDLFALLVCEDEIRSLVMTLKDGMKQSILFFRRFQNVDSLCNYVNDSLTEVLKNYPKFFAKRILSVLANPEKLGDQTYERFKRLEVVRAVSSASVVKDKMELDSACGW